jgi:hypothetical protein
MTTHIENISGSAYFKKDQLDLKKEQEQIDEVMQKETSKLVKLRL